MTFLIHKLYTDAMLPNLQHREGQVMSGRMSHPILFLRIKHDETNLQNTSKKSNVMNKSTSRTMRGVNSSTVNGYVSWQAEKSLTSQSR